MKVRDPSSFTRLEPRTTKPNNKQHKTSVPHHRAHRESTKATARLLLKPCRAQPVNANRRETAVITMYQVEHSESTKIFIYMC